MSKILIDEAVVRQTLDFVKQVHEGEWPDTVSRDAVEDALSKSLSSAALRYSDARAAATLQDLANEALDKMADNARELGLSYEQPDHIEDVLAMVEQPAKEQCWKCGDMDAQFQAKCTVPYCAMKEQAAPAQEPVIQDWMKPDALCDRSCLYACTEGFTKFPTCVPPTAPAQEPDPDELTIAYMSGLYDGKKRKPLTDEQIIKCWSQVSGTRHGYVAFARAIEAAHGITKGNT